MSQPRKEARVDRRDGGAAAAPAIEVRALQRGRDVLRRDAAPAGDRARSDASPRVLFLDEPTIALDPQTRRSIWTYIRELKAMSGARR